MRVRSSGRRKDSEGRLGQIHRNQENISRTPAQVTRPLVDDDYEIVENVDTRSSEAAATEEA